MKRFPADTHRCGPQSTRPPFSGPFNVSSPQCSTNIHRAQRVDQGSPLLCFPLPGCKDPPSQGSGSTLQAGVSSGLRTVSLSKQCHPNRRNLSHLCHGFIKSQSRSQNCPFPLSGIKWSRSNVSKNTAWKGSPVSTLTLPLANLIYKK